MKSHVELLKKLGACNDAIAFADGHSSAKLAWENCNRPDWMIWALAHLGFNDPKLFRIYACWCVRNTPLSDGRTVWDLLTDERSKNAVIVSERFAAGESSEKELAAAWTAARAAARAAAWDAADAARAAARAAAWTAAAAAAAARTAAWDAADAARTAADAEDAADAADAAWTAADAARAAARAAAGAAAWDAQAKHLREMVPYSVVSKLISSYKRKENSK